jgi:hypothetical protein
MNIAIATMVYNERINLPIWLRYYREAVPSAALFVIDHSSDDGSTEQLPGVNRVTLPRKELDEWSRTRLVNHLQAALLQFYDLFVYTDCDELIVPDPANYPSLEAHLVDQRYDYASPVGLTLMHLIDREAPIDLAKPLLAQRRYCQFQSRMCKPLITRVPLKWEPGFHACDKPIHVDPGLYMFHTKTIDQGLALDRLRVTRGLTWSQEAIDASHGQHQRYDDERFLQEFFRDRANAYRKQGGAQPFEFAEELAKLKRESLTTSNVFRVRQFSGPIVEIPERFRAAF